MLTDADIKALRREFGDQFRNLTEEQWRDLAARLPPRSKWRKRDIKGRKISGRSTNFMSRKRRELAALMPPGSKRLRFFRMFAVAANYYWQRRENPTPVKDYRQQLATAIEALQGSMEALSKLGPRFVEDRTELEAKIDAYQKQRHDLLYHADFYEGASFHRRDFALNALVLWEEHCGAEDTFSRPLGHPEGEVIEYIMFACKLVMGEDAPAAETLAAVIQEFRRPDSRLWNPSSRRSRKGL